MAVPPRPTPEEPYVRQWAQYGLAELDHYLKKHAAFDAWLAAHDRKEPPCSKPPISRRRSVLPSSEP